MSIIETTKAMIHDLDFPMSLWEDACSCVVYILNVCPHRVLKDKTLEKAFPGEKLEVSHLLGVWEPHLHSCSRGEKDEV